jgi:hypothetical protein
MQPQGKLFVFFGMIASGKSTLAEAWAEKSRLTWYNTDRLRKELAGLAPASRQREAVDQGIYSKDFSRKTYTALLDAAETELRKGRGVVLDGSYQSRHERQRVRELARRLAVGVYFIQCICPENLLKERMEKRALDPGAVSDGRWEIYLKQKERFEPPVELPDSELLVINTGDTPENLLLGLTKKFERII